MKKISILTPTYNEADNIKNLCESIEKEMHKLDYDYEHVVIDNASTDGTVEILRNLCTKNKKLKVILNNRNYGHLNSPYYGILQTNGDATIYINSDFQDPPELINEFIKSWKNGFKVVLAKKESADGNSFMFYLRKKYYRFMHQISEVTILENCTGFGLFDKVVVDILRDVQDPYPFFRGLLMEIGYPVSLIPYNQPKREHGQSSYNFYTLYDYFMLGITQHSKLPLRIITIFGFLVSLISFFVACYFFIAKLLFWDTFSVGVSPILIGIFFFGSIQALFIGILGEYIGSINTKIRKMPLVIEKERVNF